MNGVRLFEAARLKPLVCLLKGEMGFFVKRVLGSALQEQLWRNWRRGVPQSEHT